MASFFEKLKKGMGIEGAETEEEKPAKKTEEEKPALKPKQKRVKKLEIKSEVRKPEIKEPVKKEELKPEKEEIKEPKIFATPAPKIEKEKTDIGEKAPVIKSAPEKEEWLEPEGELAIDVYQTEEDLVIQSAIAGVKPENLDLALEGDRVTIRGKREKPNSEQGDYFAQECYWGSFSREIILPVEVDPNRVEAGMKDGILTIRIPKIQREKKRKIFVKM